MKLLMCPPTYYGIEYEINPWMSRSQQSNPREAGAQWDGLRMLLQEQLAIDLQLIESQPGLPDTVFTANGGLVWDHKFIVSNFRYEVRRGEAAHFEEWFRNWGFNVTRLPPEMYFEGEGDLLKCGDTWFAGYHIRSRGLDCNERWLPKCLRRARISWLYGIRNAAERVSQGRRQCEMPCLNHRLASCLDLW